MIALLHDNTPFPPLEQALREPNGLLAAGGSLTPARAGFRRGRGPIPIWEPDHPQNPTYRHGEAQMALAVSHVQSW